MTRPHRHKWGPFQRSHLSGNVHRKCEGCDEINMDGDDEYYYKEYDRPSDSWKVIKVIHEDDQPIEDEIGRVQTESLADLLLTQLDADLCADKSPGELAKEVYQTIYANTEVLDNGLGGDQHHGFYLLGAILTGGQIDVNISDRDGMPFIDFMRNVFPADHQVWDHIELSRDEEH